LRLGNGQTSHVSGDGKYMVILLGTAGIWHSSDYGMNFTKTSINTGSWYSISMSNDGKYIIVGGNNFAQSQALSTNYGVSWTYNSTGTTVGNGRYDFVQVSKYGNIFFIHNHHGPTTWLYSKPVTLIPVYSQGNTYPSKHTINGNASLNGSMTINGSISKSSGTFDIIHPLNHEKRLVHSFVEGPRCDLIYRGTTTLENGTITVNIDKECVSAPECAMEEGTFVVLCAHPVCMLQNKTSFSAVIGDISGNILTIRSNDENSADVIDWMVIAERKDPFIKNWDKTNHDGFLITEY